jgi:Gpi18-like mannosyltransferase
MTSSQYTYTYYPMGPKRPCIGSVARILSRDNLIRHDGRSQAFTCSQLSLDLFSVCIYVVDRDGIKDHSLQMYLIFQASFFVINLIRPRMQKHLQKNMISLFCLALCYHATYATSPPHPTYASLAPTVLAKLYVHPA